MAVWQQTKYRCDVCGTVMVTPESADTKPGSWIRLEMPDDLPPARRRRDLCSWRCMGELAEENQK
jgi:hypothetical protein